MNRLNSSNPNRNRMFAKICECIDEGTEYEVEGRALKALLKIAFNALSAQELLTSVQKTKP